MRRERAAAVALGLIILAGAILLGLLAALMVLAVLR